MEKKKVSNSEYNIVQNAPIMTESPLCEIISRTTPYSIKSYSPQEHLADEAVFIHGLLILALGHFGPHLAVFSRYNQRVWATRPTSFTFSNT